MASTSLQRTLDRLRIVLAPDLPDEFLLKKFISSRDEVAFATFVRRHGRMVLNVARRIVRNPHDSEDVLQATFLVLAQKARLVTNRDALASWLYKVAYRIALKAKSRNDRRRDTEKQGEVMSEFPSRSQEGRDWEKLLDEEINRLPEKYRLPIILCELEGRSRKQVEQHLQLPAGTLASRLARAKRMLADRLTRRGVVLAGGALWAAAPEATAALPATLVAATAHKAVLVAAGQLGAISGSVTVLMKAGVKAMFIAKLKATVATLMVIASLGAVGLVYSGGDGAPATGSAKPQSELEKLRKENELLRVNLRVTLEKIQVLESELRAFKSPDKYDGIKARWSVEPRLVGPGAGPDHPPVRPSGTYREQPRLEPSGDTIPSELPLAQPTRERPKFENKPPTSELPRDDSVQPRRSNKRQSVEGHVAQPTDVPPATAPAPTTAEYRDASRQALQLLTRDLNKQLADQSRAVDQESLRRAIQTLQQLLKQLGDADANRQ
jgi:RNA polymerase sigma factor (sigma-70 family)